MSAHIAKAIRAQASLLAASPAYSDGTTITWEDAANNMAEVLAGLGSNPISELDPNGNHWYSSSRDVQNLPAGVNPKEILWRGNKEQNLNIERDNYPPTLFG